MICNLEYLPEAEQDLKDLDGSQRILVLTMRREKSPSSIGGG